MADYQYTFGQFTALQTPAPSTSLLYAELLASGIPHALQNVTAEYDDDTPTNSVVTVSWDAQLTTQEQATQDSIIQSHTGIDPDEATTESSIAFSRAPSQTDDTADGWTPGSLWLHVAPGVADAYMCSDATQGAAQWFKLNGSAGSNDREAFVATSSADLVHTSTSYQDALTLQATLAGGTYIVRATYTWSLDSKSRDFNGRLYHDNAQAELAVHKQEPSDDGGNDSGTGSGTDQRIPAVLAWSGQLAQGQHAFRLQSATSDGSKAAAVYSGAMIEIERIGD